ncbi:MAG: rhodanese-like domain-containing protein [Anaerolineales bacterium]|nr:rhodanese-like domain-containing protein [Anaerolineales bacterium]
MAKKQTLSKRAQILERHAKQQRKQRLLAIGLIAVVVLVVGSAIGLSIFNPEPDPTPAEPLAADVTVEQGYELVQEGAFLLDVREQSEWDDFHAPMATLIPLGELASRVDELPQDQDIVVICNSGNRSQEGRDILLQAGFERVTSIDGGMQDWRAAGYPVE